MAFGNGKTALNRAGFQDACALSLFEFPGQAVQLQKLGAGRSRDVYQVVNGTGCSFIDQQKVIVKLEVQCPPGTCASEVSQYGGRPDWRTNEHELNAIGKDVARLFSPTALFPGLRYGHVTNRWGLQTPVCALFMQFLDMPDLQDFVAINAQNRNTDVIENTCSDGVRAITEAAKVGLCAGDMRLDNIGMKDGKVLICDLGGAKAASCKSVKASISTFLESVQDSISRHGGRICFDVHGGWGHGAVPSPEKVMEFDRIKCVFDCPSQCSSPPPSTITWPPPQPCDATPIPLASTSDASFLTPSISWTRRFAPSGRPFYVNTDTGVFQFDWPSTPFVDGSGPAPPLP